MNNFKSKKHETSSNKSHTPLLLLGLFAITILTTACGTTTHRRKAMNDVLSQQNNLLRQIEVQRREPKILRKVRRDEALWQAEATLREAIRAIRESNEAMKSAL